MEASDQAAVLAFMADPATYGLTTPIIRIDTHGAVVFLAGDDAYKIKRAVHYAFMDFSTLARRKAACDCELAVNCRNALELYLGLVPIRRAPQGLRLGGEAEGEIVEWAVHMRRFDETATFDRLAGRQALELSAIEKLAAVVLASHERARALTQRGATASLRAQIEETTAFLLAAKDFLPAHRLIGYAQNLKSCFARIEPLLQERESQGFVRHCHGDLHLRNVVLIEGEPVLFDALEFDESFAICDSLHDLAFLLMDLWQRGLRQHANLLFNRYFWSCGQRAEQLAGLAALPVFLSLRAAIRAKVALASTTLNPAPGQKSLADARHYFAAAVIFLRPQNRVLAAIGGLSGTGKTALSLALAPYLGAAPGALILRSDVERKRLYHVAEHEPLPEQAYAPKTTEETYSLLRELAAVALKAERSVIFDASFQAKGQRDETAAFALAHGVPFTGIWLEAPIEIRKNRVFRRSHDASDATVETILQQETQSVGPMEWARLDATQSIERLTAGARASIGGVRRSFGMRV
jgi:aminoglycoside phosphotransferase family enzyme/predicted kinase